MTRLMIVGLAASLAGLASAVPRAHAQAAREAQPTDGGWPRAYTTSTNAKVVLSQPQVGLWPDQKHMTMFAAVSYHAPGATTPALGTHKIEADTKVALDERLVRFDNLRITQANFQTLNRDQLGAVVAELNAAIPDEERVIGLDRVLAAVDTSAIIPHDVQGIRHDPPPIYYSSNAAAAAAAARARGRAATARADRSAAAVASAAAAGARPMKNEGRR